MNIVRVLCVTLLLSLAACTHELNTRVEEFRPAQTPGGINTQVTLYRGYVPGNKLSGELVAATDDGIVLLLHSPVELPAGRFRFVEVRFPMMRSMGLDQIGRSRVKSEGQALNDLRLRRLRLLSRFPQGLSDELLARLLESYGENTVFLLEKTS